MYKFLRLAGRKSKFRRNFQTFKENSSSLKILSSQKRGGSRGVPFEPFWLPTPSLMFFVEHVKGLSFDLNFKKPFSAFSWKKTWSPFLRDVRYRKLEGALWCCATFTGSPELGPFSDQSGQCFLNHAANLQGGNMSAALLLLVTKVLDFEASSLFF